MAQNVFANRTDYSANQPTLPNVGSNFAASGPYASYVLLKTVWASNYASVNVFNSSTSVIAVVVDDGIAATGSAPTNATVFGLAVAAAAGGQGGTWTSQFDRGRIQVYGPSAGTAQVAIWTTAKSI